MERFMINKTLVAALAVMMLLLSCKKDGEYSLMTTEYLTIVNCGENGFVGYGDYGNVVYFSSHAQLQQVERAFISYAYNEKDVEPLGENANAYYNALIVSGNILKVADLLDEETAREQGITLPENCDKTYSRIDFAYIANGYLNIFGDFPCAASGTSSPIYSQVNIVKLDSSAPGELRIQVCVKAPEIPAGYYRALVDDFKTIRVSDLYEEYRELESVQVLLTFDGETAVRTNAKKNPFNVSTISLQKPNPKCL